ncbi:flagellar motor switch protein FliM [Pelotomaculum terephthalicicum JT]|uniref:flagellar motor switch protein FliM n=1 Tax=Pelotomaculum TaxID=191373 RepID=UPI0009CCEBD8|nr:MULTISPECIES: flagellar motor switch protein FliM [Pelotomaculum]MCG9967955.1 flagellar motor switch protein FliM [Pelotomaculum terephthalicicum JT]OPX88555.1 MAG: Flagellar motor switch protein FliM [Pelotomaculum sp. PtaB.Bin117]OPY63072.1 MAG: Flagellar motor switch protein FliM [Pelotomaculum sp. PtaU1.Bin065]
MDVLSQSEIDALLNALSTGEMKIEELKDTQKNIDYKLYDFRRPNKFSEEHLRSLQVLHGVFARFLTNFLTGYLRNNIQVEVVSVDQLTYEDFIKSIPSPTVITIFKVKPFNENAIIQFDPMFLFPMIDLFFGGNGDAPGEVRELTDIELSVTKNVSDIVLDNLVLSWKDIVPVEHEILSVETNPNLHQIFPFNEIVALITMTTKVGESTKGFINLCLPFTLLDPVIIQPAQKRFGAHISAADEKERKKVEYWLGLPKIELTVVTGRAQITVRDFLQLQEGDVLVMDRKLDQDMDVYVGENLKYKAQAGTLGDQFAVQITALAGEGDHDV